MKKAVIDIGSNSVRLTVYKVSGTDFRILFRVKIMAGLAGYVEEGMLTCEGTDRACSALEEFKGTLSSLEIDSVYIFATASLRNISNSEEALETIEKRTGLSIELISGEEEAELGYAGASVQAGIPDGAFVDIGGGSTEIAVFEKGKVTSRKSYGLGSLNLFKKCVKNILPGPGSIKRIETMLDENMNRKDDIFSHAQSSIICAGGTSRAVLKLAREYFGLPAETAEITVKQLSRLSAVLLRGDRQAARLILKTDADRIHTLVPGLIILNHIVEYMDADVLYFSSYGVREGYLCRRILQQETDTCRTGN